MLRRFKDQLSQVADELPGVLNARTNGSSRDSDRSNLAVLADENGEIEGFLCPMCMTHFASPEQLSQHFETMHAEKSAFVNPNYDGTAKRASLDHGRDICNEELRMQLKEEKAYAEKLKEELDRIQSVVAQATDVPDGEVPYLLQQIQVLEAGKCMVTQRMLEFEKESSQLKRAVENGNKERGEIMAKLKQQSQQLRDLTDENENSKVEKETLNRELVRTKTELEQLFIEIDKLNKTLDQRPSEDDVLVLRTELINAQKLMDEIAQQKDVEIQEHMHAIRQLNLEREKDNCIKQNLQKELESSGSSSSEKASKLFDLEQQLEDTKSFLLVAQKEASSAKTQNAQLESRLQDLQIRLDSNMQELSSCREKITTLESSVKQSSHVIEDATDLNSKNQMKILAVSQKLEQMVEEKRKQEIELLSSEERLQQQAENIKTLEQSNTELTKELSSVSSLLEQKRKVILQKTTENEALTQKCKQTDGKVEEISSKCERQTKDLESGVSVISALREKINSLEANAQELVSKVREGGAKMAIDQLTAENKKLSDHVTTINVELDEQKQLRENIIQELNTKLRDADKQANDVISKFKKETEDLKRKLKEADEEIKQNGERFEEMEREKEEGRKKSIEKFEKLKEMVQQREAVSASIKEHSDKLLNENSEKDRVIREKERHLEESKSRIEESVKRLEEAEAKARELELALKNSELLRETASSTEEELREELVTALQSIDSLKSQGKQLTATVTEKDSELEAIKQDWDQKAQHWDSKKREYEEQLFKNQEAHDELLTSLKESQDALAYLKKEFEARQKELTNCKFLNEEITTRLSEVEVTVEKQKKKEQEIVKKLEETISDKEVIEKMKQELEEEVVTLNQKVEETSTNLQQIMEEKRQLEEQTTSLQVASEMVQQSARRTEQDLKEKMEEVEGFKNETDQLKNVLTDREAEISKLQEDINKLEEKAADEKARQKKIVEDLVKGNAELSDEQRKMNIKIEELEFFLAETMTAKEKFEADSKTSQQAAESKTKEATNLQGAVHMLNEKLEVQENDFIDKQNELQEELSKLKRSIQTLQSELDEKIRDLNEAKKTSEELAGRNMELQQQISSWNDEKNALIERCLRTESDLDFERDRALENKRRFDDSVSAMHELGRANQSLQMDISKHTTRKWLDDSAAINCTSCGKNFTMTIRKHHCRVCGLIFCGQCTDKTAKVVSNKNPVRVCGSCYTEVQNR